MRSRPASIAAVVLCVLSLCGSEKVLPDRDGDRIPDEHDPFPDDRDRPGQARPNIAYAHTSLTLYSLAADGQEVERIGDFSFSDGVARQVTDIAIDRFGVVWAVAFQHLYVCHPETARCEYLRSLPTSFNALAVQPEADRDAVIAAGVEGQVYRVFFDREPVSIGHYEARSSGDLVFEAGRLRASVDRPDGSDALVDFVAPRLRPDSAAPLPSRLVYGLAACPTKTFAFDETGAVYARQGDRAFEPVVATGIAFWGAACRASAPTVAAAEPRPTPDPRPEVTDPIDASPREVRPEPRPGGLGLGCGCT